MNDLSIGLAGAGYWGSKLARNIYEATGSRLAAVSDPEAARLQATLDRYGVDRGHASLEEMLHDTDVEAIVLATPPSMHHAQAKAALEAGKHVLVEKPLALNTLHCDELCELAETSGRTLMVGHTFVYSEPVRILRRLVRSGELGRVLYLYGQRVNLGVIRDDLNAMWNFAPHDVAILLYLLDELPVRVSARQYAVLHRRLEDVAFLVLEFADGKVAHIHDSWLDPRKIRQFTVVGDRQMAVYDDTDVESPLRIYDKGITRLPFAAGLEERDTDEAPTQGFGEFKFEVRAGDLLLPRVVSREPLRVELEHFAECVRTGARPLTDGTHGRNVIAILEAAEESSRDGGRPVELAGTYAGVDPAA